MSTIKNYTCVVLVLGLAAIPSTAQRVSSRYERGLSAAERASAVNTSLSTTCRETTPKLSRVLAHNADVFSQERIERTLTGVWRGRVKGNFEKRLLARDGFVNVDYYMIVDAKRGEALVFEQFGPTRAVSRAAYRAKAGIPMWSYVFCGKENYKPRHQPAQVHEFVKVSDNVEDARELLSISTGMKFADRGELVLSDIWQRLVETKYFDNPKRSLAYAGGLFKPFKIGNVPSGERGSLFEMDMRGEYRGSGMTAVAFKRGEPIRGTEKGKFLGVSLVSGDFLVSSLGLGGTPMATRKGNDFPPEEMFDMFYDKVVIGPLAQSGIAMRNQSRK